LRAKKILGLLDAKGKAQVWELQKVLPQVTKRTLRRDLDTLVQKGLLERKGQWNTVFYQTKTGENL
jgi:DeoR/GlpR family transcriptional regulator of sugar metabolism